MGLEPPLRDRIPVAGLDTGGLEHRGDATHRVHPTLARPPNHRTPAGNVFIDGHRHSFTTRLHPLVSTHSSPPTRLHPRLRSLVFTRPPRYGPTATSSASMATRPETRTLVEAPCRRTGQAR